MNIEQRQWWRGQTCPQCGATNGNVHPVTCFAAFQVELLRAHPEILDALDDIAVATEIEKIFRAHVEEFRGEMDLANAALRWRNCLLAIARLVAPRTRASRSPRSAVTVLAAAS